MLIIENKEFDSIDKLLKRYKKKFDKTKLLYRMREERHFVKKSVLRRDELIKARYRQLKKSGVITEQ